MRTAALCLVATTFAAVWLAGGLQSPLGVAAAAPDPSCRPVVVGNPDGDYIVPGVQGAIAYRGSGESALRLDAFVPPGARERPAVVVIHGGGYTSGSRVAYVGQLLELLADAGLPWFSVDYRLVGADRRAEAVADVRAAVAFVRCHAARFGIDANRLVLLGEDTGADIAVALVRDRTPGVVGAALVGGQYAAGALDDPVPGHAVLFVHGTDDTEQSILSVRERRRLGSARGERCSVLEVAGGIHRAENWRPSQWGYKVPLVEWLDRLGAAPRTASELAAARAQARPWPAGGPAPGLHKRLTWDAERSLALDAWVPAGEGPHPLALIAHGGGWEAGDRVTYVTPLFEPLAKAGIAWVSIDYRLTPDVRHPGQLDDVRRAIRFVRDHAAELGADPSPLVLVGESASAQMATLVAADDRTLAGVVSFYGVYDFAPMVTDASPRSLLARLFDQHVLDDEARRVLREYSPLHQARAGMPPILLVHGTGESLWAQGVAYDARLTTLGVRHELLRLVGAPHGMENWEGHREWRYKERVVRFIRDPRREF